VVFDLDGTLLEAESSWGILNRFFGNEDHETMALYRRGELDYAEFMRRDIEAWPKPLHISQVREVLSGWALRPGTAEVVQALRDRGLELAILSGGISVLADEVAAQLGIADPLANELVTDARGYLTGEGLLRVDPLRKEIALRELYRFCRRADWAFCSATGRRPREWACRASPSWVPCSKCSSGPAATERRAAGSRR
jgi:HAD superfamily PSPase-like hydrolase